MSRSTIWPKELADEAGRAHGNPPPAEASAPPAASPLSPEKLRAFILPALSVLAYLLVWSIPPPSIADPWYAAIESVKRARATTNPAEKQALLDTAGARLRELVRTYPYHARVHFLAAYYYNDAGNFDAAIFHSKEAVRLGSGASVNQVDGTAKALLVEASLRKARSLIESNDSAGARAVLDDALAIEPANKRLAEARNRLSEAKGAPR
jgi:tetratricopeptide (TPR) repeat protein